MAFNPSYTLENEICDGLGGLLELSNSNDKPVYAPLFAGQAARHNSIETVLVNPANTMDLAGIIHLVPVMLSSAGLPVPPFFKKDFN